MNKMLFAALLFAGLALSSPVQGQDYNLQFRSSLQYPGQTLANICGYAQNGREYALVGASKGMSIVDVTDPTKPVEIVQIPGPDNLWKEIKTYSHYAYVTSEGGGGVQIVDLSKLPSPSLTYHNYTGSGAILDQLNIIHALHIDATKGVLYTYGGNFTTALAHDLTADPYNPTYLGRYNGGGYVHDGYADNDTLYACHIYSGYLTIVDMSNKQNPVTLGSVQTPGKFTHNSWLLDDHKHILTTDEEYPSFVTAYDISDPTDIRELDRIARDEGLQSIGHNTHVLNDWAITSWYNDGLTIVDAHRPQNLIQVARYDTWPGSQDRFDGCWGVYPFLPSGTIVASNIPTETGEPGELFVLTPTYVRACYLEGKIVDGCTGQALIAADVKINYTDPLSFTKSANDGVYRTGQPTPGNFTATFSKAGYISQTVNITLERTKVTEINITLQPVSANMVNASVVNKTTSAPVANTRINLTSAADEYNVVTNAAGKFDIPCAHDGNYRTASWGYLNSDAIIAGGGALNIALDPEYYDDFELDLGWTASGTATSGYWERGIPQGTSSGGQAANPGQDATGDNNGNCFVTGNGGGQASVDDVDNGSVTLTSPKMDLSKYPDAVLSFWYWFYNGGGNSTPNDEFDVQVSNGQQTVTVLTDNVSKSEWRYSGDIYLKGFLPLTDNMQVSFTTADQAPGHLVEAALDIFRVVPGVVGTNTPDISAMLTVAPNPSASTFRLHYNWPDVKTSTLEVCNLLGQPVVSRRLDYNSGTVEFGAELPAGIYLAHLRSGDGRQSMVVKAVKQ